MRWLDRIPWGIVLVLCIVPGLTPFTPPHVWEKLVMLSGGELVRPLDWFDLVMHGAPWVLLALKGARGITR